MTLISIGHHHSRFHAFDDISHKTWLTWLRNATALICLIAPVAAMWVGNNLSVLMHMPLVSGISSLDVVVTLAYADMTLSLTGLVGAGFFQLRVE